MRVVLVMISSDQVLGQGLICACSTSWPILHDARERCENTRGPWLADLDGIILEIPPNARTFSSLAPRTTLFCSGLEQMHRSGEKRW